MKEQNRLFEIIKTKIPKNKRLPDEVEELLGVCSDSAYRRIRGETELSFSELVKICEKFDLSIDELLSKKPKQDIFLLSDSIDISEQERGLNYFGQLYNSTLRR